jgi:hypothetical protein
MTGVVMNMSVAPGGLYPATNPLAALVNAGEQAVSTAEHDYVGVFIAVHV